MTELNTHFNGSKSSRENNLIEIIRTLSQIKQEDSDFELCSETLKMSGNMKVHKENRLVLICDLCEKTFADVCKLWKRVKE